jgi:putative Holliday junction resolvase
MRVLALDLGAKNIGTAISDELSISIRPAGTIRRSGLRSDIARLKALVEDLEAQAVVVGLPLRMDGTVGEAARRALNFADKLRAEIGVAVYTEDERLTSYEADQIMIARGVRRKQRQANSDEMAATIILRDFLSRTRDHN